MTLDPDLRVLIERMIQTERQSRTDTLGGKLGAAQREAAGNGALGNSRFAMHLEKICGADLEARVREYLAIARRVIEEIELPWTPGLSTEIRLLLDSAIVSDSNDMVGRIRGVLGSRAAALGGHLDEIRSRSRDWAEHELQLAVFRQDRTKLPLDVMAAAPRYAAMRAHWLKAVQYLDGDNPDNENAAKEAISAVEALVRIVVANPSVTLGEGIRLLRCANKVSAPLLKGIEEVWGFTNTAPSVRHGGGTGEPLDRTQARYVIEMAAAALKLLLDADSAE